MKFVPSNGTEHARETIPFPRMLYRLKPYSEFIVFEIKEFELR